MRPLKEDESKIVLEKLAKFTGNHLLRLVDNKEDPHVLRLHKDRVFYVPARLCKHASGIPRKAIVCIGTCLGKFSKTKKFRLHITALQVLARFATHKIWLKPAGEQTFLYGNHVLKRHVGRMTEGTPLNQGIIVLGPSDIPLGFGVTAKATADVAAADTEAIIALHQADAGEYLRDEAELI